MGDGREELTRTAEIDDGLARELSAQFSDRERVELALAVALANFTNRITGALHPALEHRHPAPG